MLFHTGVIWRLYELDMLESLKRISSVSGGAITAAVLGQNWNKLSFNPNQLHEDFVPHIVSPIRGLAGRTIDRGAVLRGSLWFGSIGSKIVKSYAKHLFVDRTLQDLPDEPRFVFNATNVQTGALWRFSKPYMRDYRVGEVLSPNVSLATAVGASSAFPPILSPSRLSLGPASFSPKTGQDLQFEPYTSRALLTDGGVYDNLGLETASSYGTLFVSDAGGKLAPEPKPKTNWASHAIRILAVIDNQVRSLRKRELISAFDSKLRGGAFWSMRTDLMSYGHSSPLPCPHSRTLKLAEIPTRLAKLSGNEQERLINFGYAACDAGIRSYVQPNTTPPTGFPYPEAGV